MKAHPTQAHMRDNQVPLVTVMMPTSTPPAIAPSLRSALLENDAAIKVLVVDNARPMGRPPTSPSIRAAMRDLIGQPPLRG
jgi:hypothetical protein